MHDSTNVTLAAAFDNARSHLEAVAYRMLGSRSDAEDAVQEAWIRLSNANSATILNLPGWLTTVVARICLDTLRARDSRREDPLDEFIEPTSTVLSASASADEEILLAESVAAALDVVLVTLAPSERVAFVLHDLFAVPFDDIAPILGKSTAAARQLASRARRRVQNCLSQQSPRAQESDRARSADQEVVSAFLAAARDGNFDALLAVLDPNVTLDADASAVLMGAGLRAEGPERVARTFLGRARAAQLALIDGQPGLVWFVGDTPRVVFRMSLVSGKIAEIRLVADVETLRSFSISVLQIAD